MSSMDGGGSFDNFVRVLEDLTLESPGTSESASPQDAEAERLRREAAEAVAREMEANPREVAGNDCYNCEGSGTETDSVIVCTICFGSGVFLDAATRQDYRDVPQPR